MSPYRRLAGFGAIYAAIAAVACAAPGLAWAQCPEPGCKPPPPNPPPVLTVAGHQGDQNLIAGVSGTPQFDFNGLGLQGIPVSFTANLSNADNPVRVIAQDTVLCSVVPGDASWIVDSATVSHNTPLIDGHATVTFSPDVSCPGGLYAVGSAQVAQAQEQVDSTVVTTQSINFEDADY